MPPGHPFLTTDGVFHEVLRAADAAMYVSKRMGGNRITVTETDHGEQLTVRAVA